MIKIQQSKTADSRSCDRAKVTKQTLIDSTNQHINDVRLAIDFFRSKLLTPYMDHDRHKLDTMDEFHASFITGMEDKTWWNKHKQERHHLPDIDDLNLIDILEYVADCVMAGMARTGEVYISPVDPELLQNALVNTFKMLISEVEVEKGDE